MAADPAAAPGPAGMVAVGAIGAAVGVRGEVTVVCWTDDPDLRFAPGSVLVTDPPEHDPLVVAASRRQGTRVVVRFDGLDGRERVEAYRRTRLFVPAADRPPLADPDDFYDTDLVGLRVVDPAGSTLGEIGGVEHGPGGDRLVVRRDGRDHLVPFVAAIVPTVDVAGGRVVVDAPEGLFDL